MPTRTRRRILSADLLERERVGGFGRSVPFASDVFPNAFHISPWMSWSASGGTITRVASTSMTSLGYLGNTAAPLDLDYYQFNFEGAAGTWTIRYMYRAGTVGGIVDTTVDGLAVSTVDMYAASTDSNAVSTTAGVQLSSSGNHVLRFAVDGKSVSSSNYWMAVSQVSGVRTGA